MAKSILKIIISSLLLLIYIVSSWAIAAPIVRIEPVTKIGSVTSVHVNGEFSGFANDFIELPQGDFAIEIEIESFYGVQITGNSTGTHLKLDKVDFLGITMCDFAEQLATDDPVVVTVTNEIEFVSTLHINFGDIRHTGIQGGCSYMALAPQQKAAVVSFSSSPSGAEIWVDGEKLDYKTNTSLSIPFLRYNEDDPYEAKSVLIRADGFINQVFQIDLSSRNIDAKLEQPHEWAERTMNITE